LLYTSCLLTTPFVFLSLFLFLIYLFFFIHFLYMFPRQIFLCPFLRLFVLPVFLYFFSFTISRNWPEAAAVRFVFSLRIPDVQVFLNEAVRDSLALLSKFYIIPQNRPRPLPHILFQYVVHKPTLNNQCRR
jgi:hypothetical protein